MEELVLETKAAQTKERHHSTLGNHSKLLCGEKSYLVGLPRFMLPTHGMGLQHFSSILSWPVLMILLLVTFTSPTYNITLTQINVGGTAQDAEFSAIFDSGTSFTYLNDPAYSFIGETVSSLLLYFRLPHGHTYLSIACLQSTCFAQFNSLAKEKRHSSDSSIPFEYCYDLRLARLWTDLYTMTFFPCDAELESMCSPNQSSFETATLNMTMKGGDQFNVTNPIEIVSVEVLSKVRPSSFLSISVCFFL